MTCAQVSPAGHVQTPAANHSDRFQSSPSAENGDRGTLSPFGSPTQPTLYAWSPPEVEIHTHTHTDFWVLQNTWMIASSMIVGSNGQILLSWWQAWICVWVGYFIAACFICATGRIGAQYHISFPVVSRASFGIWGSLWPVFNRAAMAVCHLLYIQPNTAQLTVCDLVYLVRCSRMDWRLVTPPNNITKEKTD